MNITPIIRDLLVRNKIVFVPGLGNFAIRKQPARLNKNTRVLKPPVTTVVFEKGKDSEDNTLQDFLAGKLKVDKAIAQKEIEKFVQNVQEELKNKSLCRMEGLGILTVEKNGRIILAPEEELLKRLDFFELPEISIPDLKKEKTEIKPSVEEVKKPDIKLVEKTEQETALKAPDKPSFIAETKTIPSVPTVKYSERSGKKWWIAAGIAVPLLIVAALLLFTDLKDKILLGKENLQVAKNAGEDKLVFGTKNEPSAVQEDSLKEEIGQELDNRTSKEKALAYEEASPVVEEAGVGSAPVTSSDKPFVIIAGAFLVPNNANRMLNKLRKDGYSAFLLPKRGDYYMIGIGTYDTNDEAINAINELKGSLKQELWVLKRR